MKTRFVSRMLAIGAVGLATQAAWATSISFNDLPPQARQVAQSAMSNGSLKRVESVDYQGRPIYALTFQAPDGSSRYLYLNPDGSYVANLASTAVANGTSTFSSPLPSAAPSTVPLSSQSMQLTQLPQAVRNVIQTEVKNGPVSQILQLPNNSGTGVMYEVFFAKPNGQQKIIYLNPDGTYVQNNNSNVAGQNPAFSSTFSNQSLVNATVLNFRQLPPAVRDTFRNEAGSSAIQNVQMGQWNGQTVYQADINKNGQLVQMRVDPNGAILGTSVGQNGLSYIQR